MIVELVGLPGSGKTTFARRLTESEGWVLVSIGGPTELLFYNALFLLHHPMKFLCGLRWLSSHRGHRQLWYLKFVNLFLVHNAKYMKAGRYSRAVIDQGHHQNIISLFDTRVTDALLDSYAQSLPKPDLLCFFRADDETRTKRLTGRGYGARGEFNEDYREAWEEARALHFEHLYISRDSLPFATEEITPDDGEKKLEHIKHTRSWYFVLHGRMPTEKAHGLQIAKTIEALREKDIYAMLWIPRRKNLITTSVGEYYDVRTQFPVRTFCVPDFLHFPISPASFRFWIDALGFFLALAFARVDKSGIFLTRNPELAWLLKIKGASVWYEAHSFPSTKAWLLKFFLAHVDGIVANSQGTAHAFTGQGFKNVHVVRNGVDIMSFFDIPGKEGAHRFFGEEPPKNKTTIMYVGTFYAWKGVPFLLETWRKHFSERDDLRLVLVGGSEEDLKKYGGIEAYRGAKNIELVPHVSTHAVPFRLATADILVLPNVPTTEESIHYTSPIKLFEYMTSERPIVAADLPSIREILNDEAGIFFRAGNSDALANAITTTLQNPDDAKLRASCARNEVLKYTWAGRAQLLLNIVRGQSHNRVSTHAQFLKTITAGVCMALLYLTLIYALTTYLRLWYVLSVTVAYVVIFVTNFLLLKLIFVGGGRKIAHELSRYALLVFVNFFLNELATYVLVEKLDMWYMLAQLLIVGTLAIMNFFVYRSSVFQTIRLKENSSITP